MQQEKYDNYFSIINNLYSQYIDVNSKKDEVDFNKKWAIAYKEIREKIILAVCKVYFEYEIKEDTSASIPAIDIKNRYDDNYSDIVIEEIIKALDSYDESSSKKNGCAFSYYVCRNIRQEVGKARSKNLISVNHGGAEISDYEAIQTRKVIKKDRDLEKLGIFDEEERNKKLVVLLGIGIDTVKKYKALRKRQTGRTEIEKDGKTYSVLDLENNLQEKNFITPETIFISKEFQKEFEIKLPLLLQEMEAVYLEKPKERTAKLLAISILRSFENEKKEHIKNGNLMNDFHPNIHNLLSGFSCLDKEVIDNFFLKEKYDLPTKQEIATNYKIKNSTVSKDLSRFRDKLMEKPIFKDYFLDFL